LAQGVRERRERPVHPRLRFSEGMSWYDRNPAPAPDWDVCWDFLNKSRSAGKGGKGFAGSRGAADKGGKGRGRGAGRGRGSWGGQWWDQPPPWAAWPQSFWGGGGMAAPWLFPPAGPMDAKGKGGMFPATAWWASAGGKGGAGKSSELDLGELAPSLERAIKEKGGRAAPGPPPPPPPQKDFEGSIKSLSVKHGYGFIVCDEVHKLYGRDTYLPEEFVGDAKVLDRVQFKITLSKKGHPQASSCQVLKL